MYCNRCGNMTDPNAKYCNKCGNLLQQVTIPPINHNTSNNKKLYIIACISFLIFIFLIFIIIFIAKDKVFFNSNTKVDEKNIVTNKSNNYRTSIVFDNTYEASNIKSKDDALNLIVEDSNKEKKKCKNSKIVEIENRISKNYNITAVNLCELNYDFALEIEKVVKTIYNNYPASRGYLTNLTLTNTTISNQYIAMFMPFFSFATSKDSASTYPWVLKTLIGLNSTYYLNTKRLEASVKDGSISGHFPKNANRYSPVAHEFGHYLSFLAMLHSYNGNSLLLINSSNYYTFYDVALDFVDGTFSKKMIDEAYQNYKNKFNSNITELEFRESISMYAVAKDSDGNYIYDETIAESFHDYYVNGNNASKASLEIIAILNKYLGEGR